MQLEKNCLHRQQHRKKLFVLKKFSSPRPSKKIMVHPLRKLAFVRYENEFTIEANVCL